MPSIGPVKIANRFILAPMAGVSEMPFRVLALEHGAGLAPTELISARGLEHQNRRTRQYLLHSPREQPFCVQLFGGEPRSMAIAAERAVEAGAQMLDINMGCPVKKVTKTGAGSALLCDAARASDIVRHMRRAVGEQVPITAKMRSGWDSETLTCFELARALEDAGVAAVALHARTRAQGYSGQADWKLIRRLKELVGIPVIGNGDVRSAADAERMLRETRCDFVMVGRAALGNPWIFGNLAAEQETAFPTPGVRLSVVRRHLRDHLEFVGDEVRAVRSFRQHLIWYSKGLRGGAAFRESVMRHDAVGPVLELCEGFFDSAQAGFSAGVDEGVDYAAALG
jgi:nifR3 family TIM-barrel protein